jgi:hypothetical protein
MIHGVRRDRRSGTAMAPAAVVGIRRRDRRPCRDRHRLRPVLLALEDRRLLSTFTVNSTADSAPASDPATGTLRWAIEQADAAKSASTIDFNLG